MHNLGKAIRYKSSSINIIKREKWGARKPIIGDKKREYRIFKDETVMKNAYKGIAIHHPGNDSSRKDIKNIQSLHMDKREKADIGYHFAVGLKGKVFEGRAIGVKGSHLYKNNSNYIGIVLLADLDEQWWDWDDAVSREMNKATMRLIKDIRVNFPKIDILGGHKEFQHNTGRTCPGNLGLEFVTKLRSNLKMRKPQ